MKKLIFTVILLFIFSFPVSAEEFYSKQYEASGIEDVTDSLDEETQKTLDDFGIDPQNKNWINEIKGENVFSHIQSFLSNGLKAPLKSGGIILCVILLVGAVTAFDRENGTFVPAMYTAALSVAAVVVGGVFSSITAAVNAIKGCSSFMLSFVPIFTGIIALSGGTVTSVSSSAMLLLSAEAVSSVASFGVIPLMGGYLAMSISSGLSPLVNQYKITETVKKFSMWVLSFICIIFVGILGIQTAINASGDSLTLRTARFLIGTSIPVAGRALSEAASTISASVSLLRSSVGIYGIAVIAVILLPIITEIIIWRFVMLIGSAASEILSLEKVSSLLKSVDSMLSLLLGITLLVGGMFIISLAVVSLAGRPL